VYRLYVWCREVGSVWSRCLRGWDNAFNLWYKDITSFLYVFWLDTRHLEKNVERKHLFKGLPCPYEENPVDSFTKLCENNNSNSDYRKRTLTINAFLIAQNWNGAQSQICWNLRQLFAQRKGEGIYWGIVDHCIICTLHSHVHFIHLGIEEELVKVIKSEMNDLVCYLPKSYFKVHPYLILPSPFNFIN